MMVFLPEILNEIKSSGGWISAIKYRGHVYHNNGENHNEVLIGMFRGRDVVDNKKQDRMAENSDYGYYHPEKKVYMPSDAIIGVKGDISHENATKETTRIPVKSISVSKNIKGHEEDFN